MQVILCCHIIQEQVPVAKDCEFDNELNYTIVVEEYAGTAVTMEQSVISSGSDSCVNGLCETSFAVTENSSYVVSLTATNELGFSSVTVESATVGKVFINIQWYPCLHMWQLQVENEH